MAGRKSHAKLKQLAKWVFWQPLSLLDQIAVCAWSKGGQTLIEVLGTLDSLYRTGDRLDPISMQNRRY